MRRFLFALLMLSACATGPEFNELSPVGADGQPELRVRIAYYPLALRTVYVVRPNEVTSYESDGSRWRGRRVTTNSANRVLATLDALAELDGRDVRCAGVVDGNSMRVEGASGGRHFSFTAGNPDSCSEPAAQQVSQVIGMIEDAVR